MEEIWPEVHQKYWKNQVCVCVLNITFNFLCVYEAYTYSKVRSLIGGWFSCDRERERERERDVPVVN